MRRLVRYAICFIVVALAVSGLWVSERWSAITIGPKTIYFDDFLSADLWLHEALHRRQWDDQGVSLAIRYLTDKDARLDIEAEAEAAELCLYLPRSSDRLSTYTRKRSAGQAEAYMAGDVHRHARIDRVGHFFDEGRGCERLLRGIDLREASRIFPASRERRKILTAYFLQRQGSDDASVAFARKRLLARF